MMRLIKSYWIILLNIIGQVGTQFEIQTTWKSLESIDSFLKIFLVCNLRFLFRYPKNIKLTERINGTALNLMS